MIAIVAIAKRCCWRSCCRRRSATERAWSRSSAPIHGRGFLALLALCTIGWSEKRWDWWFPALVVVTLGPPGSLIGDYVLRRKLQAEPLSEASG